MMSTPKLPHDTSADRSTKGPTHGGVLGIRISSTLKMEEAMYVE